MAASMDRITSDALFALSSAAPPPLPHFPKCTDQVFSESQLVPAALFHVVSLSYGFPLWNEFQTRSERSTWQGEGLMHGGLLMLACR